MTDKVALTEWAMKAPIEEVKSAKAVMDNLLDAISAVYDKAPGPLDAESVEQKEALAAYCESLEYLYGKFMGEYLVYIRALKAREGGMCNGRNDTNKT